MNEPPSTTSSELLTRDEVLRRHREIRELMDRGGGDETRELAAWFLRRYPSFVDRCRYVTRKYREWTQGPKANALEGGAGGGGGP